LQGLYAPCSLAVFLEISLTAFDRFLCSGKESGQKADCRQRVELLCDSTTRNSFYADNQAETRRLMLRS